MQAITTQAIPMQAITMQAITIMPFVFQTLKQPKFSLVESLRLQPKIKFSQNSLAQLASVCPNLKGLSNLSKITDADLAMLLTTLPNLTSIGCAMLVSSRPQPHCNAWPYAHLCACLHTCLYTQQTRIRTHACAR